MSVTVVIDKLQDKGYLRRVNDEDDRRLNRIHLTPSAEALLPALRDAGERWLEDLLVDVPIEDQQVVVRALGAIRRSADRMIDRDHE
jgi:DNA-binding MarR family transcriptional regulator